MMDRAEMAILNFTLNDFRRKARLSLESYLMRMAQRLEPTGAPPEAIAGVVEAFRAEAEEDIERCAAAIIADMRDGEALH